MTVDNLTKQATSKSGFIRAYGLFWEAGEVDWTGAGTDGRRELLGRLNSNSPALRVVNFWDQRGIYVLYNDYGPYYVGKTRGETMSLGKRLAQHATDKRSPHCGRWTRFSWFGWRGVLKSRDSSGFNKLRQVPEQLLTTSEATVGDIETLLIHALGTRNVGNGREERFAAALRWEQIWVHERSTYLNRVAP